MSSRYGRNKRRAARERIAALEQDLRGANAQLKAVSHLYAQAKAEGATEILRVRYLDQYIGQIVEALTEKYGPELMKAAQKLIGLDYRRPSWLDLRSVVEEPVSSFISIEGSIPSLHYRIRVLQDI